jgi:predicted MPP superfamily phosphohydrolase
MRIVHFSDAHLGSFRNTKLLSKFTYVTQSFRPDLVCFTGDLVNNYGSEPIKYRNELKQMAAGEGNYAILGNHDYGDYTKWPDSLFKSANFQDITEAFRTSGFRLLLNDSAMLTRGGDTLYITGFSYPGRQPLFHKTAIEQVVNRLPAHCFCIALCHDPELWTTSLSRDSRFGLTLSGHTHGLQWGYYPAGIALSMARLVRKNWAGHYRKGNSHLYVNRGTGVVGMFFRIDMPAEITLLTLKRVEVD